MTLYGLSRNIHRIIRVTYLQMNYHLPLLHWIHILIFGMFSLQNPAASLKHTLLGFPALQFKFVSSRSHWFCACETSALRFLLWSQTLFFFLLLSDFSEVCHNSPEQIKRQVKWWVMELLLYEGSTVPLWNHTDIFLSRFIPCIMKTSSHFVTGKR